MESRENTDDVLGHYKVEDFSRSRVIIRDYLEIANTHGHYVYGLLEVDVTAAKEKLAQYSTKHQTKLSFTGWLMACIAKCASQHSAVHSMLSSKHHVVFFEDVDISITVEKRINGKVAPMPLVVRKVNQKGLKEITEEIRKAQNENLDRAGVMGDEKADNLTKIYPYIPKWLRKWVYRRMLKDPFKVKRLMGSVVLTSVGMFGKVSGWPITKLTHPLGFAVGSVMPKPRLIGEKLENREILNLTVAFDHFVVDGGPAARFINDLVSVMEKGDFIPE